MKLSALVAIAAVIGGSFLIPMPAGAESCSSLKGEAEKACYAEMFTDAGIIDAGGTGGCPSGQGMATWKNKKMGCMTPAQYELWNAQMTAAHRANRRTWVMPNNNTYAIQNLQNQLHQQQLNNSHQHWRTRNGYGY